MDTAKIRVTYGDLLDHISEGLVRIQGHPKFTELVIVNYTQECQFKKVWTPLTKMARGLVVRMDWSIDGRDTELEIVARPFQKFFNLSEHNPSDIPTDVGYTIYEKMDGSLGICFKYRNEWIWATRGSFTSDQAMWAKNYFESNYSYDDLDPDYTHMFEIIYNENRIVVNYDYEGLVSLGSIHTETGTEVGPNSLFPTPKLYEGFDLEDASCYSEPNIEGFVVHYDNGFRVKVKTEEYVHLHRIVFGLSSYRVWDALREGKVQSLLSDLPEEFTPWVKKTAAAMLIEFHYKMSDAYHTYLTQTVEGDRKQTALNYQKFGKHPISAVFSILDGKDPSDIIWKTIKPAFETIQ